MTKHTKTTESMKRSHTKTHLTESMKNLKGQMWVDILEDEMGEVHGIIYEHDNYAELNKIVLAWKSTWHRNPS